MQTVTHLFFCFLIGVMFAYGSDYHDKLDKINKNLIYIEKILEK